MLEDVLEGMLVDVLGDMLGDVLGDMLGDLLEDKLGVSLCVVDMLCVGDVLRKVELLLGNVDG